MDKISETLHYSKQDFTALKLPCPSVIPDTINKAEQLYSLWSEQAKKSNNAQINLIRARGVVGALLELALTESTSSLQRLSALSKLEQITSYPNSLTRASQIATYYPLAIIRHQRLLNHLNGNVTELPSIKDLTLRLIQPFKNKDSTTKLSNKHETEFLRLFNTKLKDALDYQSPFDDLRSNMAQALSDGLGMSIIIPKLLAQPRIKGPDAIIYRDLSNPTGFVSIGEVFDKLRLLEEISLSTPPLTNCNINKTITLAVLFSSVHQNLELFDSLLALATSMEIKSSILPYVNLLSKFLNRANEDNFESFYSHPTLAKRILGSCQKFIEQREIRDYEITELALGTARFLRVMIPHKELVGAKLEAEILSQSAKIWLNFEAQRTALLISGKDIKELAWSGPPPVQISDNSTLTQLQLVGILRERKQALNLFDSKESSSLLEPLLKRSGASLSQFQRITPVGVEIRSNWKATYFEGQSLRQTRPWELASEIIWELESGNYPSLRSEMEARRITPLQLVEFMKRGGAHNLVELESLASEFRWKREFLPGFGAGLDSIDLAIGPQISYARIERNDGPFRVIDLSVGCQGYNSRIGYGVAHMRSKNPAQLAKVLGAAGKDRNLVKRCIDEGIIPIAGESNTIIPSGDYPELFSLIIGSPKHSQDTFMSVVVGPLIGTDIVDSSTKTVITVILHEHSRKLRNHTENQILHAFQKTGDFEQLMQSVSVGNKLLENIGELPLDADPIASQALVGKSPNTLAYDSKKQSLEHSDISTATIHYRKVSRMHSTNRGVIAIKTHSSFQHHVPDINIPAIPPMGSSDWSRALSRLRFHPFFSSLTHSKS